MPRVVEKQGPFAPDRLELVAVGHRRAAVELREHVTREAHRRREHPVGSRVTQTCRPVHGLRLAGEQPRAADAVTPDIHQCTTLEIRLQPDVLRVVQRIAERRPHEPKLADRAVGDQRGELRRLRVVAPHERLGQDPPGALGGVERGLHLLGMARHRLLAEHVLPGLDGPDRPLAMHRVRQRHIDGLDLRVGEHVLIRAVGARNLHSRAYASARAASRLATPTSSTFDDACAAGIKWRLMCAVEMIPHLTGSHAAPSSCSSPARLRHRPEGRLEDPASAAAARARTRQPRRRPARSSSPAGRRASGPAPPRGRSPSRRLPGRCSRSGCPARAAHGRARVKPTWPNFEAQ